MPIVEPTLITPYGTPPSSSDPLNFDARADAKVAHDAVVVTQTNELAINVYDNALAAQDEAQAAATHRANAEQAYAFAQTAANQSAASAGASRWVSGTFYEAGIRVWSPVNSQIYARRDGASGAGTTDPSLDYSNWRRVRIEADLQTARAFFLI